MSSSLQPLHKLRFINLEYNRFTCDHKIEETLEQLKKFKVHVKIDKCGESFLRLAMKLSYLLYF